LTGVTGFGLNCAIGQSVAATVAILSI